MNPILRKELRTLLRERRGFLIPMMYAVLLVVCAGLSLSGISVLQPAQSGQTLGVLVIGLQTFVVALLAPLVGAGGIAGERERGTLARLLASPVKRSAIAWGKAKALTAYVFILLSVSLPVTALAYELGGIDKGTIISMYVYHALLGAVLVCLGLVISSYFERSWSASMVAVTVPMALCLINLALWYALHASDHDFLATWIAVFNIGYGQILLVGASPTGTLGAGVHAGFLIVLGLVSMMWLSRRMRIAKE